MDGARSAARRAALAAARLLSCFFAGLALALAEECVELTSGLDRSLACAAGVAAQVQGVYVPPAHRGRGLATAGMAAVAALGRSCQKPMSRYDARPTPSHPTKSIR